jgi:hypothetical protein
MAPTPAGAGSDAVVSLVAIILQGLVAEAQAPTTSA